MIIEITKSLLDLERVNSDPGGCRIMKISLHTTYITKSNSSRENQKKALHVHCGIIHCLRFIWRPLLLL